MTVGFRDSRYIIGIDLGTTNSVVSYVDRYADNKSIETFPVMQVIASGELDKTVLSLLSATCHWITNWRMIL